MIKLFYHSHVVGTSPVGAAPTTSSFLTCTPGFKRLHKDNCKTRRETFCVWGLGVTLIRGLTVNILLAPDWGETMLSIENFLFNDVYTTLFQRSWKGVYWFHLVRPSILNVCGQNRVRSVSLKILFGSILYLHILSSNFRRCFACKVFFKIRKIWSFGKFFKFVTLTSSCFRFVMAMFATSEALDQGYDFIKSVNSELEMEKQSVGRCRCCFFVLIIHLSKTLYGQWC